MRYTWPKKKLCRREWINLFGTEKYDLSNQKRSLLKSRKTSEFGGQLRKKQTAKRMFGLSEKQFIAYYKKAVKSKAEGTTWEKMLRLIELRLDNVVYRANFARTRMQSRQFVSHAHFKINWVKSGVILERINNGTKIGEANDHLIIVEGIKILTKMITPNIKIISAIPEKGNLLIKSNKFTGWKYYIKQI